MNVRLVRWFVLLFSLVVLVVGTLALGGSAAVAAPAYATPGDDPYQEVYPQLRESTRINYTDLFFPWVHDMLASGLMTTDQYMNVHTFVQTMMGDIVSAGVRVNDRVLAICTFMVKAYVRSVVGART
jgi:hypothetical protein